MQPCVGGQPVELRPAGEFDDGFTRGERADKVFFVPTSEDDQFARGVVHARPHDRGIPLPAIGADDGRIGFEGILVEVVEDEAVDAVTRERPFAPDGEQSAAAADDLHFVGRTDITGRLRPLFDGRGGKKRGIFARFDDTLYAAVEFRSQRPGIGGDRNAQVGIEPQHVGRKQCRRADALAVLGRHGDDQTPDAPGGKSLQHTVIRPVEGLQLEEGIDRQRECAQRRGHTRSGGGSPGRPGSIRADRPVPGHGGPAGNSTLGGGSRPDRRGGNIGRDGLTGCAGLAGCAGQIARSGLTGEYRLDAGKGLAGRGAKAGHSGNVGCDGNIAGNGLIAGNRLVTGNGRSGGNWLVGCDRLDAGKGLAGHGAKAGEIGIEDGGRYENLCGRNFRRGRVGFNRHWFGF